VVAAFVIGAVMSITSVLWSLKTSPELPLEPEQVERLRAHRLGIRTVAADIVRALREMPATMRQLALVKLFQWYAMFCYWQYIMLSLSTTLYGTTDPASAGFREAGLLNGQIGAFYNFIAFVAAFALIPFTRRFGAKHVHSFCLAVAGASMLSIPLIREPALLFLPMVGVGLAWASIMGNPYVMLAGCIPPERTGVYMGIFNMFIVIPMIIQIFTLPLFYRSGLGGNPENVIRLAGALMLCAAVSVLWVKIRPAQPAYGDDGAGEKGALSAS
jgi:maltose/moltooligosaccharide transporter